MDQEIKLEGMVSSIQDETYTVSTSCPRCRAPMMVAPPGTATCKSCGTELALGEAEKLMTFVYKGAADSIFPAPMRSLGHSADLPSVLDVMDRNDAEFEGLADERSIALVGAMLVEQAIDDFLGAVAPGIDAVDSKDLTFSLKIALARACKICSAKLFNDADLIRHIRNDFSHRLTVREFSAIDPKHLRSLRDRLAEYEAPQFPVVHAGLSAECSHFRNLVVCVSAGISMYALHARTMGKFLRTARFRAQFEAFLAEGQDR
jgi:hypothetical protein